VRTEGRVNTDTHDTIPAMPIDLLFDARKGDVDDTQLTISGPKAALVALLLQPAEAGDIIASARLETDGALATPDTLAAVPDTFNPNFNIVTP
jgi:hypothetical protein